jgi:DnaJ-class molecular chaperone
MTKKCKRCHDTGVVMGVRDLKPRKHAKCKGTGKLPVKTKKVNTARVESVCPFCDLLPADEKARCKACKGTGKFSMEVKA